MIIVQDILVYGVDFCYCESEFQGEQVWVYFIDFVVKFGEMGVWVWMYYVYFYLYVDWVVELMVQGKVLLYFDILL